MSHDSCCCTPEAIYHLRREMERRFDALEARIMTQAQSAAEQIDALSAKIDAQGAVIDDVAADFAAFRDAMEAERENLTPSGQNALDAANRKIDATAAKLASLDTEVGDADGSDAPAPTEPGDGGDTGEGDGPTEG